MPEEFPNPQEILLKHFADGLLKLMATEKQLVKSYNRIQKAAVTAELVKALTPEISDQTQHLSRLKLIHSALPLGKLALPRPMESLPSLKLSAKKTAEQDLLIIGHALKWQNLKLAHYEFLHPLAKGLGMETEATLLEQTISDNRNTNTWLRQIIQNILAPALKINTKQE